MAERNEKGEGGDKEEDMVLKNIENNFEEVVLAGRRTSYYVEENEKILNLLITNCEPILSEIGTQVNHFNTYNKMARIIEKSEAVLEELNIG